MVTSRSFRIGTLGVLALLSSCSGDERGLSFELGTSQQASTAGRGGSAGAGGKNAGGTAGNHSGNSGSHNAGASGSTSDGDAGDTGTAGTDSGEGGSAGSSSTGGTQAAGMDGGGSAGMAGSGGSASGSGGMGGSSGTGGSAGDGGSGGAPFESPCGDLNDNRVDDCNETLLQNSRFDSAVTGWQPEGSLQQAWATANARPTMGSGSLSLVNASYIAGSPVVAGQGSDQCLVAWGDDTYELGARMMIKETQVNVSAAVDLVFYGNDGCQGTVLGGKTAARTNVVGSWQAARGTVKIPAGTRSVNVRLTISKPLALQASVEALFDDVLAVKK